MQVVRIVGENAISTTVALNCAINRTSYIITSILNKTQSNTVLKQVVRANTFISKTMPRCRLSNSARRLFCTAWLLAYFRTDHR